MGTLGDAVKGIRKILEMTGDIERLAEDSKAANERIRDIDRRLIVIETIVDIARGRLPRP